MTYKTIQCTFNIHQSFMNWCNNFYCLCSLAITRPVINLTSCIIIIPFLRTVKQFQSIRKIVTVIRETVFFSSKNRPGTLKLYFTLRLFKCQRTLIVIMFGIFHSHMIYNPILHNGHFQILGDIIKFRWSGNNQFACILVYRDKTSH